VKAISVINAQVNGDGNCQIFVQFLKHVPLVNKCFFSHVWSDVCNLLSSHILLKNAIIWDVTPCGLQEPHGITPQKTAFFIVTAMKTSNLTHILFFGKLQDTHNEEVDFHSEYEKCPFATH
jgi:hypothetical protein